VTGTPRPDLLQEVAEEWVVEWYPRGWAAADDGRRRSARPATHGVVGHPGPQSVQQKRPGPRVAQQSVPLGAEILEGLPEREGEPQVAQIPEGPPGLAGKVPRYLQW
jgi:hypothetical protein